MEPLRIAQVCRVAPPSRGGMEAVVSGLSRALSARGHDVVVAAPEVGPIEGVRTVRTFRRGPSAYPWTTGLLDAVQGRDVVHVHGIDAQVDWLVATRAWHGAAVGVSTHGALLHRPRWRRGKRLWLRAITRHTLRRA